MMPNKKYVIISNNLSLERHPRPVNESIKTKKKHLSFNYLFLLLFSNVKKNFHKNLIFCFHLVVKIKAIKNKFKQLPLILDRFPKVLGKALVWYSPKAFHK